jgi:hypothetical protein
MRRRITFIAGHYGSGKSEISVNLAIKHHLDYLVDLDVINPYFRSRALKDLLDEHGITLVESTVEGKLNSDMPYVSGKGRLPLQNKEVSAIYDLGGTENGTRVLHQFIEYIEDINEIDFLCVVNIFRPETASVKDILHTITMYEAETQLKITGLINNTNLMDETSQEMIDQGEEILKEVSKILGIPVLYTVIEETKDNLKCTVGERLDLNRYVAKKWL